jgi:hypothetical protein
MWTNVCIEGYCFGEKDGKCPCGKSAPTDLCLKNGMCPHFAYSYTSERNVAKYPKLYLILWDRLCIYSDSLWWKLRWWFWDSLWFNRRKTDEFFKSIKTVSSEDCPELKNWEDSQDKSNKDFSKWFKKAKRDYKDTLDTD